MASVRRTLAAHLFWLVLASVVPVAGMTAALTMSFYAKDWLSATALAVAGVALSVGASISILLARQLHTAIADLATEAAALGRGHSLARIHAAVQEIQAVGDALEGASRRVGRDKSAVEAGSAVDLEALLGDTVAKMDARARLAGLELSLSLAPGLGAVRGSRAELEEAMLRLLVNAVTFTRRGARLSLGAVREPDGGLRIALSALESEAAGPGMVIAGHAVELNCHAHAVEGIAAARSLVMRNGGTLDCRRASGRDESVTIRLPAERVIQKAA